MIAGLVRIAGGRLALAGGDPERTIPEQAHYLGHQDALKPSLTVAENLGSGPAISAAARRRAGGARGGRAWTPLADLPAAYLSAGQRRRLSIARLVAVKRPIWLLDEPTSALDREAQDTLAGLMRRHLAGGGLIVAAAHGPIGLERARKELRLGSSRMSPLAALFIRDSGSPIRVGGGGGIGVLFFLIVVVLMPFAIGPDLALLGRIGPAILWLGALLASLLTLDRLLAADHEDGSLDLILMGDTPLELAVAAKAAGALADHRPAAGDRHAAARPVHEPRRHAPAPRSR